jgi:hypothetical protein
MAILMKVAVLLVVIAAIITAVIVLDRKIARLADFRWRLLARSLLYALAFTPTVFHHPPNTIVAPLHLSTIGGNLFYAYDYTLEMFLYGVVVPLICGWAVMIFILLFGAKPASETLTASVKLP